jgi:hypothetical protein
MPTINLQIKMSMGAKRLCEAWRCPTVAEADRVAKRYSISESPTAAPHAVCARFGKVCGLCARPHIVRHEAVRALAHALWRARGLRAGSACSDWFDAERRVDELYPGPGG